MARGVNTADDPGRRGDRWAHRDREMSALGYQKFHEDQGHMFMRFPDSDPRHPGNPSHSPNGKLTWDMTGYYRGPAGEFTFDEMSPPQYDAKLNVLQGGKVDRYNFEGNSRGENFWDTRFPNREAK